MNLTDARRFRRSSDPRVRDEARKTLDAARARKARVRPKRAGSVAKKRATREERMARLAEIRAHAYDFTGGRCIVCMCLLGETWDLHHIVSGGLRRTAESKTNCVATCPACHRLLHRGDLQALESVHVWALANGDSMARLASSHRIAKVLETQR